MNAVIVSYEGEDRCPHCGMPLHVAGIIREEVPEETATESQMSLKDILVLPIGVVAGLLLSTFPLSLPALYGIALLFMK